eukprot:14731378-Alexandrium_andersonii.AAC.1
MRGLPEIAWNCMKGPPVAGPPHCPTPPHQDGRTFSGVFLCVVGAIQRCSALFCVYYVAETALETAWSGPLVGENRLKPCWE